MDRHVSTHPHVRTFFQDHLGVHLPESLSRESTEQTSEPPLTPKIKVHEAPNEPEEEIQYIGVGLGTLSREDKRPRANIGQKSASEPILQNRASSESVRSDKSEKSDTSATSGQLTPYEPMVYSSPMVTHENVFEEAFKHEEERIRQSQGDDAMLYSTWRSEEFNGEPISNEFGRTKVELARVDSEDTPRWEKILKERFPERFAEIYQKKEDRKHFLQGLFAHKLLREQGQVHPMVESADNKGEKPVALTQDITAPKSGPNQPVSTKGHKRLDALRSVMDKLKSGAPQDLPSSTSESSQKE